MLNEIQMIPVELLAHHPENPRLDIGDITELTASIKANGILQNLTVVFEPAHKMSPKEWSDACKLYDIKPDEDLRNQMNRKEVPDRYLVVIGNRRLEAAKAAGLTELPCSVRDMDHNEQVATMLQENMQRTDLTIYEQAKGIQMMMDLGFDKAQIAERTGFSKTTIDRRLAVATLPEEKAKEAVSNGYDLLDLVEISKIDDREKQRKLLDLNPGERNIRQEITNAQKEQKRKKTIDKLLPEVKKFAKKMKNEMDRYSSKYTNLYDLRINLDDEDPKVNIPEKHTGKDLCYVISYSYIEFYEPVKRQKAVKTEAQIALEKKQHDAAELNKRMLERIASFIQSFNPTKKMESFLKDRLFYYSLMWRSSYNNGGFYVTYHNWSLPDFRKYIGMPIEEGRDPEESIYEEMERRNVPMGRAVLALMLSGMLLNVTGGYCNEYNADYKHDTDLDRVYEVLEEIGYQLDDEERQWKEGTHPIFGNKPQIVPEDDNDGEETGDDD